MAAQSDDTQEIIRATKQVLNNCIVSSDINVDTLPFFDVDYLFIALRAKSVGEKVNMNFVCLNKREDGSDCKGKFPVELDIQNIEVYRTPDHTLDIKMNEKLIFKMKYPTYSVVKTLSDKSDVFENSIKLIAACIDKIFHNDQFYNSKDFSPEELQAFIENLTQEQFTRLENFVKTIPIFSIKAEGTCPKCGKNHNVRYNDFVNFFR